MQSFQLLKFPMPKRDWTPDDIEMIARLLRACVTTQTIANQFKDATVSDILEIARLMGFRRPKYPKKIVTNA
jgi:predicted glycosyltransferase involved in capsule biosynthesis